MEYIKIKVNQSKIQEIGDKLNLRFLVLYGSAALGKLTDDSDIDIAYLGSKKLEFKQYLKLSSDITSSINMGFRTLDLVDLKRANLLLKYEITRNGKLLYGDASEFTDYQVNSFMDYIDGASLRMLESEMIHKRQKTLARAL